MELSGSITRTLSTKDNRIQCWATQNSQACYANIKAN